ncbi:molybdopterin molybdotransferase MoeA [Roseivirga sp. UBA1976]|uniref:molybdopterin molybdotransferase MoeA n=1 Tax=Roseivirga sp. UBA1976 TaxID=1947386 RepID=UPI00257AD679|nr:molybdopterin molybdotransferase MoeA [Roseivirga sp. UBA1976]
MISYQQALDTIAKYPFEPAKEKVALQEATGRILASPILADRDLPPYDRVTMDGIAINFTDFANGQRAFTIHQTIGAGTPKQTLHIPGKCVQIMTGAIMPQGLDTVIRYEDLSIENGVATIQADNVQARQNIHFKGSDKQAGEIVVDSGKRISHPELIVAAAVGLKALEVLKMPKAAIITTGDELVDIGDVPKEHQVRRSSNYGVQSLLNDLGIEVDQFHIADDKNLMIKRISSILESYKLIVLTGGVSRGKFDYLPEVLEELGVTKHFHKVKQRPGKPFWFGTHSKGNTVFALPGNPVSSFVCALVYIRHWVNCSLKIQANLPHAILTHDLEFAPELTYFIECSLEHKSDGTVRATTFKGNGSGDFANMIQADGFLVLPENKNQFKSGESYPYLPIRN